MKTCLYEITSSNVDGVAVGSFIVDTTYETARRGTPRTWHIVDMQTGDFTVGFAGAVLHRLCGPCRDMNVAREHKHNGRHGKYGSEPELQPVRLRNRAVAS